jgi:hypothetical protein
VELHLDEEKPEGVVNEALEQIAYADRVILNKTDLVRRYTGGTQLCLGCSGGCAVLASVWRGAVGRGLLQGWAD